MVSQKNDCAYIKQVSSSTNWLCQTQNQLREKSHGLEIKTDHYMGIVKFVGLKCFVEEWLEIKCEVWSIFVYKTFSHILPPLTSQ